MRYQETDRPQIYEINTRVWLAELARLRGEPLTLAEVPEEELDRIARWGVDLVWLMGVWRTGEKAVAIARADPGLAEEYRRALPDFTAEDVAGSPYSVAEYTVDPALGGAPGLIAFRNRLQKRGLGLILDFVSNHTGIDHRWTATRPEYYVQGDEDDLRREPGNFFAAGTTAAGPKVLAHGRDPYFPGWTDTAQLNFHHPGARAALQNVLRTIAGQCDGVRCDMAMLVLDEVFRRVWGERALRTPGAVAASGEFWAEAIADVRRCHPRFLFLAEAYWGLEGRLQDLGFDGTYDKTLYDRLLHGNAQGIRAHLEAPLPFQSRTIRFLENHDEPRAAAALPGDRHRAAALVAATLPGMRLIHEGEFEGRRVKVPVQLRRRPEETERPELRSFHARLQEAVADPCFRRGRFRLLAVRPAWEGNPSWEDFLAWEWEGRSGDLRLLAVNYAPHQGQCYVECARAGWAGSTVELDDQLGSHRYLRDGSELVRKGLYFDLPAHGHHLFRVAPRALRAGG